MIALLLFAACLIAVGLGLVGAVDVDADVGGLVGAQLGEHGAELADVEAGDLLVELLGQEVDVVLVLAAVAFLPELELSQGLIGEGAGHDETGVAGGAAQIHETAGGEDDDALAVLESEAVDLGLDVLKRGAGLLEAHHVDLVVEMADVADDGVVLHLLHVVEHDDILVTGSGHEDVHVADKVVESVDFESLHQGLESADGIDLRDEDTAARTLHGGGATLADVTVTGDEDLLAAEHDVGGAVQTVRKGVTATVDVVELGLGDAIVDVDCGEEELTLGGHLFETVDTGGGLLRDTTDDLGHLGPLQGVDGDAVLDGLEDDLELGVVGGGRVGEGAVLGEQGLSLAAFVDQEGDITAVIDDHVWAVGVRPGEGLLRAPPVLFEGLALPGEDLAGAGLGASSGGVVLGGENVARAPADLGTELVEGLDQDGGLDGHVEGTSDLDSLEGLGRAKLPAGGHQTGHLNLGEAKLLAAEIGEGKILDLAVRHVYIFWVIDIYHW